MFVNVGFGNLVNADSIVSLGVFGGAPSRRLCQEAADKGMLVDLTEGRKTRAVIQMDSGYVIKSANEVDTIGRKLDKKLRSVEDVEGRKD